MNGGTGGLRAGIFVTKIKVRTGDDAYAPDPLVKAIELLGRGSVIAFRRISDGYAVIYLRRIEAAQALALLKQAGIDAVAEE